MRTTVRIRVRRRQPCTLLALSFSPSRWTEPGQWGKPTVLQLQRTDVVVVVAVVVVSIRSNRKSCSEPRRVVTTSRTQLVRRVARAQQIFAIATLRVSVSPFVCVLYCSNIYCRCCNRYLRRRRRFSAVIVADAVAVVVIIVVIVVAVAFLRRRAPNTLLVCVLFDCSTCMHVAWPSRLDYVH